MKKHPVLFVMLTALMLAACEKAPVETDPDAYRLKGTLSGWAAVNDYKMVPNAFILNSAINVTAIVDGKNYKTVTDSTGRWSIKDFPAGIYSLRFEKEGFSTVTVSNQQFVGGGELERDDMFIVVRIPSEYGVSDFRMDTVDIPGAYTILTFAGTVAPDTLPAGVNVRVYIVRDTSLDVTETRLSYSPGIYEMSAAPNKGERAFTTRSGPRPSDLYGYGFNSGDTVYMFAHVANTTQHYSGAMTPRSLKFEPIPLSPVRSNVVKFVLP